MNNTSTHANTLVDTSAYTISAHGKKILKSNLHLIEAGYKIAILNGHVYKMEIATNKPVEDFGEYHPATGTPGAGAPSTKTADSTAAQAISSKKTRGATYASSGWVAGEEWHNTTGVGPTINYFSATCTVPYLPITQNDQTFAFWIGVSPESGGAGVAANTSTIVQPILNYGPDVYTYGGNYYQVFSVFDWGPDGAGNNEAYTVPTTVTAGTNIKFIIQYTGLTGTSYDYVSEIRNASTGATLSTDMPITINNVANNNSGGPITIPAIPALNYADIVFEDPRDNITGSSEYPNTGPTVPAYIAMTNITISTGNPGAYTYPANLGWYPVSTPGGAQNGESAQIVNTNNNNATTPGQVNLWWGPIPPPPPANAVISILNVGPVTNAILFEGTSHTYNILANTGNSSTQVAPDTYSIIFNSTTGNEYYEIFNSVGQVIASNLSNPGQVVTLSNVTLTGNYSLYIGSYGD